MATLHRKPPREDLLAEVETLRQERENLLAEVETLRQNVTALRQERDDLETMLETTTEHFDHLSESLLQERDDLKNMLEVTTAHFDDLAEVLEQERDNLETMLGISTEHFDYLSESLLQERDELKSMLEMTTTHFDGLSETLQQERDDLETMLEMTTEHSDALEDELQTKAEELEARNQFIRETFGRYVSDDVVAQLLDSSEGLQLGGEKRTVTILMSDLRGFTALAERLDPQEVLTFLNRYLEVMVNVILGYQGTIIEILGDGLLVVFGAPIQRQDDAERAVACAVAMQLQLADANAINRRDGLPEVEMGIGIHTGDVVVGNIGSHQRTKYGTVGSAVNLAGRIESYTTGGQILISETTCNEAASLLHITQQMRVEPKGVSEPLTIFEVGGIGGEHHLFLPDQTEVLATLNETIPIRYTVLEEKFAGRTVFTGRLVKLAVKTAELHTDHPVAALSNLKLQLMHDHGKVVLDDVFAKVVRPQTDSASCVVIRFTSLPEDARVFLEQCRHAI